MNFKLLGLSLFVIVFNSGCFGITVLWPSSFEEEINLEEFERIYKSNKESLIDVEIAKERYEDWYGEPVHIENIAEDTVRYFYNQEFRRLGFKTGLRWVGFFVFIQWPVPIPLALPIGREKFSFTTYKGKLIREDGKVLQGAYFNWGFYIENYSPGYGPQWGMVSKLEKPYSLYRKPRFFYK